MHTFTPFSASHGTCLVATYLNQEKMDFNEKHSQEYRLWVTIGDVIGEAKNWPKEMRKLFWTPNLKNFQRFLVCLFSYINGLHPDILLEWVTMKGLCRDMQAYHHIRYLMDDLEFKPAKYKKYYQYNVSLGRYENVLGEEKTF